MSCFYTWMAWNVWQYDNWDSWAFAANNQWKIGVHRKSIKDSKVISNGGLICNFNTYKQYFIQQLIIGNSQINCGIQSGYLQFPKT